MLPIDDILRTDASVFRELVPAARRSWFALCRLATSDGQIHLDSQSAWAGFSDVRPFRELRQPRLVRPDRFRELVSELLELPITVADERALLAWMLLGGHALVERGIAVRHLQEALLPQEVGRIAGTPGFTSVQAVQKSALRHAPSKALRLDVLLRDKRRCRVCGRSPDEDVHASLDVHHGVRWGGRHSGLTVRENLFTLCQSCHQGITDDTADLLLKSIGVDFSASADDYRRDYFEGVLNYRRTVAKDLKRPG